MEEKSQVSHWQCPQQFALGSLGQEPSAPKAKAKARSKKASSVDSFPDIEDTLADEVEGEALNEILQDEKLKIITDSLGSVPKCLMPLQPSKILDGDCKPIGHQLRGV